MTSLAVGGVWDSFKGEKEGGEGALGGERVKGELRISPTRLSGDWLDDAIYISSSLCPLGSDPR